MQLSLGFHIIGMVLWLGGLVMIPRIMKGLIDNKGDLAVVGPTLKRAYFGFTVSGMVLALITGIIQFFIGGGASHYMKQGWFHGKLTFLIVLLVVTVILGGEIAKMGSAPLKSGKLLALHIVSASALIIIVLMTMLGRVGGI